MRADLKTPTEEIREIQGEMARIRHDLHQDVRGVVKQARAWTNWGRYVRERPFLTLGAAAALGYWIVPHRRGGPVAPAPTASVAPAPVMASSADGAPASSEGGRTGRGFSMLGAAFGLVSPIVVRAAQNYAIHRLNEWMGEWREAAERSPSRGPQGPVPSRAGRGNDWTD